MTPEPPSSSEGSSLPPRSRINLSDLVKDSHETNLWAFDDLDSTEDLSGNPSPRSKPAFVPTPRKLVNKAAPGPKTSPLAPKESGSTEKIIDDIRVNVGKFPIEAQGKSSSELANPVKDVDELDDWDVTDYEPPTLEIHPSILSSTVPSESLQKPPSQEVDEALSIPETNTFAEETPQTPSVTAKDAPLSSLVPRLGLSTLEKIGLWAFMAILLIGGGLIFMTASNRLPTDTGLSKSGDFPAKGQFTEILSAMTHWRAPIAEGKNADTFRRGTQLLPVIVLTSQGGPAAIRLFFRDQDGAVVGDAITHMILPNVPLQVAATAGFDDLGMHAAYRTGQSKPWTVEVREAPALDAPNSEFKRLFEIEISTDRR